MAHGARLAESLDETRKAVMSAGVPKKIKQWMRPSAAALEPYDPAFSPVDINLSANENSFGLPPELQSAVADALKATPTNRYPSPLAPALRKELSLVYNIAPKQLICGNGGDELLFNLFVAFGGQGHVVLHCPPDFSVYDLYAGLLECPVQEVPRDPTTFKIDEDSLVEASRAATITIVTSPNNPTGNLVSHGLVSRLCKETSGLVVVDEAYVEFARSGASCVDLLGRYDNLVILRTLSKAYALAGVRLGYILADPGVVSALAAVRQPYSVSVLDQSAALAVLRRRSNLSDTLEKIKQERKRLYAGLCGMASLGVTVWPSDANFLLVRVPSAHKLRCRLRDEYSILVRDFSSAAGLKDCLRITVGMPQENDSLLRSLTHLLEESCNE